MSRSRTAAVVALASIMALASLACDSPERKREKDRDRQLDALGDIAERYRKKDPADGQPAVAAIAGRADYDEAREAVGRGDMPSAIASLQRATAANPECAEYWYNLGAAQANRAIEVVQDSESEAIRVFGESVDSKRRALELMEQGKFQFYDAEQQQQVRSDCENGLRDADAVLADPASLVAALRMYASAR